VAFLELRSVRLQAAITAGRPAWTAASPSSPAPACTNFRRGITGLDAVNPASGTDDHGSEQRAPRQDHVPHDVVADPESREVIYRENDVRAQAQDRPHPDQALLRYRAYRPAITESDSTPVTEAHANIKA
jgi:hypothetical protein